MHRQQQQPPPQEQQGGNEKTTPTRTSSLKRALNQECQHLPGKRKQEQGSFFIKTKYYDTQERRTRDRIVCSREREQQRFSRQKSNYRYLRLLARPLYDGLRGKGHRISSAELSSIVRKVRSIYKSLGAATACSPRLACAVSFSNGRGSIRHSFILQVQEIMFFREPTRIYYPFVLKSVIYGEHHIPIKELFHKLFYT